MTVRGFREIVYPSEPCVWNERMSKAYLEDILHSGKRSSYDSVIAALSFDTWRFLLVRRLEPTVWRALRAKGNGGMPNYPGTSRADFEAHVKVIYELRNRCSHQEHLVMDTEAAENAYLDRCADALRWVAERIEPEAAGWTSSNSRVAAVRASRTSRQSPAARPGDQG